MTEGVIMYRQDNTITACEHYVYTVNKQCINLLKIIRIRDRQCVLCNFTSELRKFEFTRRWHVWHECTTAAYVIGRVRMRSNMCRLATACMSDMHICDRRCVHVRRETTHQDIDGQVRGSHDAGQTSDQQVYHHHSLLPATAHPDTGSWWEEPSSHHQLLDTICKLYIH